MYYTNIYGHFNFEFLYDEVVAKFDSGSKFVEIGAFCGKSTCYLAERVIASGKDIQLNIIDNWVGHPSDTGLARQIEELGDIYKIFHDNMEKAGVIDKLNILRGDSAASAKLFENGSIDFVYIDAAHDYASVKKDVLAWLPKMKAGGILAGHDYGNHNTQVKEAVNELFGNKIEVIENTWIRRIPNEG